MLYVPVHARTEIAKQLAKTASNTLTKTSTATTASSTATALPTPGIPSPGTPGQFRTAYFARPGAVSRPVLAGRSAGFVATLQGKNAWDAMVHGTL